MVLGLIFFMSLLKHYRVIKYMHFIVGGCLALLLHRKGLTFHALVGYHFIVSNVTEVQTG